VLRALRLCACKPRLRPQTQELDAWSGTGQETAVYSQDVANAFGTSVGAKAITLKQAIVIAAVCEFTGAVLMGAGVASTIRSGIADLNAFLDKPDLLAYGMLCALLATGLWLIIATYWEVRQLLDFSFPNWKEVMCL
jgi:hypothetical protein